MDSPPAVSPDKAKFGQNYNWGRAARQYVKIRCVLRKNREARFRRLNESVPVMNVKTAKIIALTISGLAFAIGFSDLQENMFFWLGRPVGAIALIAFFIFMLLEKEYALMDEQEHAMRANFKIKMNSTASEGSNKEICAPALTTAALH
jgi:hypothetical protein